MFAGWTFLQSLIFLAITGSLLSIWIFKGGVSVGWGDKRLILGLPKLKYEKLKDIVDDTCKLAVQKFSLKNNKLLYEEMRIVERKFNLLRENAQGNFLKLLKEKRLKQPAIHEDYIFYSKIFKLLIIELTERMKKIFIENSLIEKEKSGEMPEYIDDITKNIRLHISEYLDVNWFSNSRYVTRDELIEMHNIDTFSHTFNEIIREIFHDVLKLIKAKEEKIKKIDEKFNTILKSYIKDKQ